MPAAAGNCWSIAETVGPDRPYRLHHLLERARREEDTARDMVRAFLTRHLGADGGVLIFDETGQAKKGTKTAALGRRYSGTMGRVENVIVAVYTTYATKQGHALIDQDLYVQADWFDDPARMATAGPDLPSRSPDTPSERASDERPERRLSVKTSPVTPTPHIKRTHKTAGQASFFAGSRIATHSTWCVIGNRSNTRSVRTR
ncbi:transposase [Streptomyces fradiae]|uniref:transposase n=1 Tax=Streptomyces fradiae TaxID=1906 RepID=UPI003517CF44